MPHHGSNDDFLRQQLVEQFQRRDKTLDVTPDALRKQMDDLRESFGATGEFPKGQLHPTDEGAIRFGIAAHNGKVIMDFGTEVVWLGLDPKDAENVAQSLLEKARQARNQRK